jgi:hypothetical protein
MDLFFPIRIGNYPLRNRIDFLHNPKKGLKIANHNL